MFIKVVFVFLLFIHQTNSNKPASASFIIISFITTFFLSPLYYGVESTHSITASLRRIVSPFSPQLQEVMKIYGMGVLLLMLCFAASANGQKHSPPAPPLTPAPAPEPVTEFVNLADLLSVAGPFHTFLKYLESTKLIETLQDQANKTEEGLTLFVPKDDAFSSIRKSVSLSNLTQDQLKSVLSFHAIPHYYSFSDFRNLSLHNPIPTFAGGPNYGLNFTDDAGTIHINTGWTITKVISAVHAADPVAIYETDRVLLPEAIFGTDIPPMPALAPAPAAEAPAADSPTAADDHKGSSSTSSSSKSAATSLNRNAIGHLATASVGALLLCFWCC